MEGPGRKYRQPAPLPFRPVPSFYHIQIGGERHLGHVEFVKFEVAIEQFRNGVQYELEVDVLGFHRAINHGFDTGISREAHSEFQHAYLPP